MGVVVDHDNNDSNAAAAMVNEKEEGDNIATAASTADQSDKDERRRCLNQHFSPRDVASLLVAKACQVMPCARLYLEPTAGDGAIFYHLPPERRLGVEIDVELAQRHGFVCQDILLFSALPEGIEPHQVCVVGNPPFTDRSLYKGNRRASGRVWLADFMRHVSTLCARAVLLLPSTVFGRVWFEQSPLQLTEYCDLGEVAFDNLKNERGRVHVYMCVFQTASLSTSLPPTTATTTTTTTTVTAAGRPYGLADAHRWGFDVVEAGDTSANCAVVRWAAPSKIGHVITDRAELARMRSKLSERQLKRRASATALFLRVYKPVVLYRLQDMRRQWRRRFANTRNTSVSFSLLDFIKAF